jgi:tetratricopeptide (TPR) repeat protein
MVVTESDGVLRHLAFFEELGKMDEGDAGWRAVSAGLVTMRLVDRWIAAGSTARLDSWSVSAVREAIAQVTDMTPTRRILTSVVDVMVACTAIDMHALSPRLMAYGQALEYDAKWSLAADVYGTIAAETHLPEDADLVVGALLHRAFCLGTAGSWDAAAVDYEHASRIATDVDDMAGALRGRLGIAKVATARGNMPKAEAILDEAIDHARDFGLDDVRSRALNDRAWVAGLRGQHDVAIRFSYDALSLSKSQRERDRILTNIATGFRFVGRLGVARDAYLVLAATAQEQFIRWNAELCLLEVAAEQGSELQFDRYRRVLEAADLSPQLRVSYHLNVGRGYGLLNQPENGVRHLEQAVELAAAHGFNQLVFEAEAALSEARRNEARREKSVPTEFASSNFDDIVLAIESMKETAGIS